MYCVYINRTNHGFTVYVADYVNLGTPYAFVICLAENSIYVRSRWPNAICSSPHGHVRVICYRYLLKDESV